MIMILNLRPTTVAILNTVVEAMEDRFTEEEQQDIVDGVVEVLGPGPEPTDADGDSTAHVVHSTEPAA